MIISLTITLSGFRENEVCSRTIEIDEDSNLEDLHYAIQEAVEFYDDHLYAFYVTKSLRSRERDMIDEESGLYEYSVRELQEYSKGRKLFYWFDFGDDWIFQIKFSRKKPAPPTMGISYPRITKKLGDNPEQYPECDEE